jgi:DUF917 family protein
MVNRKLSVAIVAAGLAVTFAMTAPVTAQQPKVRTLTEQEIMDMMLGSSIQASRGANTQQTVDRMKALIAQGKKFTMINVDDIPDDWTTVTVAGVGGGGAWEYVRERVDKLKLPTIPNATRAAVDALSKHIGKTFNAVIRIEAVQAAGALALASDLGVPVVDACLSGRARPEIEQQIPWINGIPSTPASLVTRWGDTILVDKARWR